MKWMSLLSCVSQFCYPKLNELESSVAQLCPTLCGPVDCSMPGFPVHHQLLEVAQTVVHRVSDAIHLSHSLPSPPAFNLFQHQGLFQWVLRMRCPKYWSFSFSISPSNVYSRLISFRIDWFDLLAVQGMLKSLLQHHSSKASIWCLAFFMSNSHNCIWLWEKPQLWLYGPLLTKWCLFFLILCL